MKEKIIAVQQMQDYIETHLMEKITLCDLSNSCKYSPFYCARLFKELTYYTPMEYIRRLKLSQSAIKLRDKKCKIIDLAFETGYNSVDGYQRAFYNEFGCNPHEYAKNPIPLTFFIPYGVKYRKLWKERNNMEKSSNIFIQVIEKPQCKVIIKRATKAEDYMSYCEEVGCDVWGILTSIKSLSGEPICLWLPDNYRKKNTSKYVQGVEVPINYDGIIPATFEVITLPKTKYLMFQGEPFNEEDYCQAIEKIQSAMSNYNPSIIGYEWDEENPTIQLEPRGERGYIELKAIKLISK